MIQVTNFLSCVTAQGYVIIKELGDKKNTDHILQLGFIIGF